MGGFVVDVSPLHDYHGVMTLAHHALLKLAEEGLYLPMPDDSIRDKSKADYLAKALVFLQVFFLLVQTIARKAQALPFSLLEIHTLVHAVCAVGMYLAWLGKPLDIKDPTDISREVWSNPVAELGFKWQKEIAEILIQSRFLTTWTHEDRTNPAAPEIELAMSYSLLSDGDGREAEPISVTSNQRYGAQLLDSNFDGLRLIFSSPRI